MVRTLEHDDVVFMYTPKDTDPLVEYRATFIAWGGAHKAARVKELHELGIHCTGTMWCLTAGAETLHENADAREAVCRDITGEPILVPWLQDAQHFYEDTKPLFGCTNTPAFRAHTRKTVCNAMAGGADGLHIDDHLGAAGSLHCGGCFCDRCMKRFAEHLQQNDSAELRAQAGVKSFDGFDYRTIVRNHASTKEEYMKVREQIPLMREYADMQLNAAAEHTVQLGKLAAEIVRHPITLSANCCLPWENHMVVIPNLTHIVGEVPHDAKEGVANLGLTVSAYRFAEALGKPIAATAHGWDWAHVKEKDCKNLVRLWIALSYACGQRFMAPHRMWCHTPEKGTHWYYGPTQFYAPLYQFVRRNRELFRDMQTAGPLAVPPGISPEVDTWRKRKVFIEALGETKPLTADGGKVWLFPRTGTNAAVVHALNLDHDAASDSFTPKRSVEISIDEKIFGRGFSRATLHSFDTEPRELTLEGKAGKLMFTLPELKLWGVVKLEM